MTEQIDTNIQVTPENLRRLQTMTMKDIGKEQIKIMAVFNNPLVNPNFQQVKVIFKYDAHLKKPKIGVANYEFNVLKSEFLYHGWKSQGSYDEKAVKKQIAEYL